MSAFIPEAIKNGYNSWWTAGALAVSGAMTYLYSNSTERAVNELFQTTQDQNTAATHNSYHNVVSTGCVVVAGIQLASAVAISVYRLLHTAPTLAPIAEPPLAFASSSLFDESLEVRANRLGPPPGFTEKPNGADSIINEQYYYSSQLTDMAKVKDKVRAKTLFEEMKMRCVPYNAIHFTIMIDLHANLFEPEKSQDYFNEMLARRITPTVVTYSALLKAFMKGKKADLIEHLVAHMQLCQVPLNNVICYQLCEWYYSQGDIAKTQHFFSLHPVTLEKHNQQIDCHGLTYPVAYMALQPHLQALKTGEIVYIVTGKGHHSKHGQGDFFMRDTLINLIRDELPHLQIGTHPAHPGGFDVRIRPHLHGQELTLLH